MNRFSWRLRNECSSVASKWEYYERRKIGDYEVLRIQVRDSGVFSNITTKCFYIYILCLRYEFKDPYWYLNCTKFISSKTSTGDTTIVSIFINNVHCSRQRPDIVSTPFERIYIDNIALRKTNINKSSFYLTDILRYERCFLVPGSLAPSVGEERPRTSKKPSNRLKRFSGLISFSQFVVSSPNYSFVFWWLIAFCKNVFSVSLQAPTYSRFEKRCCKERFEFANHCSIKPFGYFEYLLKLYFMIYACSDFTVLSTSKIGA